MKGKKLNSKHFIGFLIVVSMIVTLFVSLEQRLFASNIIVTIDNTQTAAEIKDEIQLAIDEALDGYNVIINGAKTNEKADISLNIPKDIKVVWKANTQGIALNIKGGGTFEVNDGVISIAEDGKRAVVANGSNIIVTGGKIEAKGEDAGGIKVTNGNITISGGEISALGDYAEGISVDKGNIYISGGSITADADVGHYSYAVYFYSAGTLKITGGKVTAKGAVSDGNMVISLSSGGLAAYLPGTIEGVTYLNGTGIILEVASLSIPATAAGTFDGLTRIKGVALEGNVKWDFTDDKPTINFQNGKYTVKWGSTEAGRPAAEKPVKLVETATTHLTINEAILAADAANLDRYVIEVYDDFNESGNVSITKDVTIVGKNGTTTMTMPGSTSISVSGGGQLTLGDGNTTNIVKIIAGGNVVRVLNGNLLANDGVFLKSNGGNPLFISGSGSTATITGGRYEARNDAIQIERAARIIEISGGVFTGGETALHVTDLGTRIEKISGGAFYQIEPDIPLHGQAIFMQNDSYIGEISGGYFETSANYPIGIVRGAWLDKISGGEFVSLKSERPKGGIYIGYSDGKKTGIGEISGGYMHGGFFALILIGENTQVNKITGGNFEGTVAVQVDVGGTVDEISGGRFTGAQGLFNVGLIKKITGNVEIKGTTSYGIFNWPGGRILEISGGTITSTGGRSGYALLNQGQVDLISDGVFIGDQSAVYNNGSNNGTLGTISGGIFWGKNGTAIVLTSNMILEPGLNDKIGKARFWGKDGKVFNDESLVIFPVNSSSGEAYFLSDETMINSKVNGTEFKFLRGPDAQEYQVTVVDSYATNSGAGDYEKGAVVIIDAGERAGFVFDGWTTSDGVIFADRRNQVTSFIMPEKDVAVRANWRNVDGQPSTGDVANTALYFLLAISFVSAGMMLAVKKKERLNEYNEK